MTRVLHGSRWLLAAVAALGLAASIAYYFWPEDGVEGSLGVEIVIVSTILMTIAAAAVAAGAARRGLRTTLDALILLDILGTGFAAYMLEAEILLGLMVLALVVWLFAAFARATPSRQIASAEAAS